MTKDNGDWLSAEQAVLPDGTERDNLSLINKKLPALSQTPADSGNSTGDNTNAPAPQATNVNESQPL